MIIVEELPRMRKKPNTGYSSTYITGLSGTFAIGTIVLQGSIALWRTLFEA